MINIRPLDLCVQVRGANAAAERLATAYKASHDRASAAKAKHDKLSKVVADKMAVMQAELDDQEKTASAAQAAADAAFDKAQHAQAVSAMAVAKQAKQQELEKDLESGVKNYDKKISNIRNIERDLRGKVHVAETKVRELNKQLHQSKSPLDGAPSVNVDRKAML